MEGNNLCNLIIISQRDKTAKIKNKIKLKTNKQKQKKQKKKITLSIKSINRHLIVIEKHNMHYMEFFFFDSFVVFDILNQPNFFVYFYIIF